MSDLKSKIYNQYAMQAVSVLGLAIKNKRISMKINQESLAQRIGANRKTVHAIETGQPTVAIGKVFAAAAILKINLFDADERLMDKMDSQSKEMAALLPKSAQRPMNRPVVNDDF